MARVFVESESDAPDGVTVHKNSHGQLYYALSERGGFASKLKNTELLELVRAGEMKQADDLVQKPFSGPDGQGPWDSMDECIDEMEGNVDDAGGWCAWAHEQDTGEHPSKDEVKAPEGVPDQARHLEPGEDPPEGAQTFDGPSGGTYFLPPGTDIDVQDDPPDVVQEAGWEIEWEEAAAEDDDAVAEDLLEDAMVETGVWDMALDEADGQPEAPADELAEVFLDEMGVQRGTEVRNQMEYRLTEAMEEMQEQRGPEDEMPPSPEPYAMSAKSGRRRVFVSDKTEVPEGVEAKTDEYGRVYYQKQAWRDAGSLYPEDVEDEHDRDTDVETTEPEEAGEGVEGEEEYADLLEDLADRIREDGS